MALVTLDRVVRAGDLFNSLEREEERTPERKFEVKTNPRLEELIEILGKNKQDTANKIYSEFIRLISDVYSGKEIEQLSILISDKYNINFSFSFKYGLFLSSLINRSPDQIMTIHTSHLETPIEWIGHKNNGKIINVDGNVGDYLGYEMSMGKINVNGNVEDYLGYELSGGELIVNGNVGDILGNQIEGGKIIVNGNAGETVGRSMQGGEIHLNGDYEYLSHYIEGGNIYHQGVQLIKNGKAVPGANIKWF